MRRAYALLLPLAACASGPREVEVRYRIAVEVLDGGVRRTGMAVWSYTAVVPRLALVDRMGSRQRVEAIPIRLGDGRWLFVLPYNKYFSGGASDWLTRAFGMSRFSGDDWMPAFARLARATGEAATVDCAPADDPKVGREKVTCPTLLATATPDDPASLHDVGPWPGHPAPHAPTVVALHFTITDQPPTDRLPALLPWLARHDRDEDDWRHGRRATRPAPLPVAAQGLRR